jgi:hypothetical protein
MMMMKAIMTAMAGISAEGLPGAKVHMGSGQLRFQPKHCLILSPFLKLIFP